ncbi:MAG: PHB depolymerase family esterase, partial [Desulfobacteraceae bacterium]
MNKLYGGRKLLSTIFLYIIILLITMSYLISTTTVYAAGEVSYDINIDWGSGAIIGITITNTGSSAISDWILTWTFPGDQKINNMWNGSYTQNGASVEVEGGNSTIQPNSSISFGFQITYSGSNDKPSDISLNGEGQETQDGQDTQETQSEPSECTETRPDNTPSGALTQVSRSLWARNVPSSVNMYIYVPGAPSSKPPIVVSCHSCGNSASGQFNNNHKMLDAADKVGFIMIFPDNSQKNCWDVGSTASLTHDGGGDTQAIAQMVQYALTTYNGDPDRVYIMGGSSGAMMTQAMLAVYPDIFKAGSARAGVPAGCWADGYDPNNQWCGNCAGGRTIKTAQQWGDLARRMYPGYDGPRPRVQLFHGMQDTT